MTVPRQWPNTRPCRIAFVGEAPGVEEVAHGVPLVGRSGKIFNKLLRSAGIDRFECLVTNVFDFELPRNDIKPLCVPQKQADKEEEWPQLQTPIDRGAYVPAGIAVPALTRLRSELRACEPNVVVALGGSAVWALLGLSPFGRMKKMRGTLHEGLIPPGQKALVTYHPAYVLRNYQAMPLVTADLLKARRESATPEISRAGIQIIIPKTPGEVEDYLAALGSPAGVDIETLKGTIDNIGFADCFERAMSVPIYWPDTGANYWKTEEDEVRVIAAICGYLNDPSRIKVMQNGSYDVQWLFEKWGAATQNWTEDTRLLHHALWPESPKDLGTIASLHLDMPGWKLAGAGRATTKKED